MQHLCSIQYADHAFEGVVHWISTRWRSDSFDDKFIRLVFSTSLSAQEGKEWGCLSKREV